MKQKDIILIIVVLFVSGIFSFFVSNALFGSPSEKKQEAEVVEPITAQFTEPDKQFFNEKSLNPTELIQIGKQDNKQPF